jgi:hypothetical protein
MQKMKICNFNSRASQSEFDWYWFGLIPLDFTSEFAHHYQCSLFSLPSFSLDGNDTWIDFKF